MIQKQQLVEEKSISGYLGIHYYCIIWAFWDI